MKAWNASPRLLSAETPLAQHAIDGEAADRLVGAKSWDSRSGYSSDAPKKMASKRQRLLAIFDLTVRAGA